MPVRKLTRNLTCAFLLLAGGCGGSPYQTVQGSIMGSYYVMTANCQAATDGAFEKATDALAEVDADMSTWRQDSPLMLLNATPPGTSMQVSPALWAVLSLADEVRLASGGAFDVSVGALVNAWGFGPSGVRAAPDAETVSRLRPPPEGGYRLHSPDRVERTRDDVFIDLSAIAPGHAVDAAIEALQRAGCTDAMVDVSGEVRVFGHNREGGAWRIGIETPSVNQGGVQAVIELADQAVATSGDYRNYREVDGRRISHTIDPRDGHPIRHRLASITVVQETAARADTWATALDVLGPQEGLALAEERGFPVYMLVRGPTGFESRYTSAMKSLMDLP